MRITSQVCRNSTAVGCRLEQVRELIERMKKDTDLDVVRDREDFKKLIAELEAKTADNKP